MHDFLIWLEDSWVSLYVRESESIAFGFPGILTLHTLGMGFLAGVNFAIALRILGVAKGVKLIAFERLLPVFWVAFAVNVASGILLFLGYPTKAITNPVFYLKLALIVGGVVVLQRIRREAFAARLEFEPFSTRLRWLAVASLACWIGAITAGRFLAYTHRWLLVDSPVRF